MYFSLSFGQKVTDVWILLSDLWSNSFSRPAQRDAKTNGAARRTAETNAGEAASGWSWKLVSGLNFRGNVNIAAAAVVFRSVRSASPKCLRTPSWRWTRRPTWASSSPTWWMWSTPGPTGPRSLISARWPTFLKVCSFFLHCWYGRKLKHRGTGAELFGSSLGLEKAGKAGTGSWCLCTAWSV